MFILNLCLKVATYTIIVRNNNALTGVGAFIASGSQACKPN
jgi:hypothetical protein